jgi:hypothetical protein
MCASTTRERPLITAPNGPLMARPQRPKSGCNTLGDGTRAQRVTAALSTGTPGQRIRESGDTGDACPRPVSPILYHVFPARKGFVDTGDTGDSF